MSDDMAGRNEAGSPARAGIDPSDVTVVLPAKRFPRTRGDRPVENGSAIH